MNSSASRVPKRTTATQLTRIDPNILSKVSEGLLQLTHKAIILRAVGDEEFAHTFYQRAQITDQASQMFKSAKI
jgi:hypothetical protein